jgi:hypothetical protein
MSLNRFARGAWFRIHVNKRLSLTVDGGPLIQHGQGMSLRSLFNAMTAVDARLRTFHQLEMANE